MASTSKVTLDDLFGNSSPVLRSSSVQVIPSSPPSPTPVKVNKKRRRPPTPRILSSSPTISMSDEHWSDEHSPTSSPSPAAVKGREEQSKPLDPKIQSSMPTPSGPTRPTRSVRAAPSHFPDENQSTIYAQGKSKIIKSVPVPISRQLKTVPTISSITSSDIHTVLGQKDVNTINSSTVKSSDRSKRSKRKVSPINDEEPKEKSSGTIITSHLNSEESSDDNLQYLSDDSNASEQSSCSADEDFDINLLVDDEIEERQISDDGDDAEDSDYGDDRDEEDEICISLATIKELEKSDNSLSSRDKAKIKETEDAVDRWCREWLTHQSRFVRSENMDLASTTYPTIIQNMVKESNGLFKISNGFLVKTTRFRSSMISSLLDETYTYRKRRYQLLQLCLAVMLENGSHLFRNCFESLSDQGEDGILDLNPILEGGTSARDARRVVGLYARSCPHSYVYVGLSNNIGSRQRDHDTGKGVNHKVREIQQTYASDPWTAKVLVSFGKTSLRTIPEPVLSSMESLIIGAARTTTNKASIQVNIVDRNPFKPAGTASGAKTVLDIQLIKAWGKLWELHLANMESMQRGPYGIGFQPLPLEIGHHVREGSMSETFLTPYARAAGMGFHAFHTRLFRGKPSLGPDGRMTIGPPSRYLAEFKLAHPIPKGSFWPRVARTSYADSYNPVWAPRTGPNGTINLDFTPSVLKDKKRDPEDDQILKEAFALREHLMNEPGWDLDV
ncbi:hypothetical protein V866_003803 [Kwoniella sp. B9012]